MLGVATLCTSCEVSAIPLAPLGKSTDKVGGDKLQMPSVAQVKVSATICDKVLRIQPVLLTLFELLSLVSAAGYSKQGLS